MEIGTVGTTKRVSGAVTVLSVTALALALPAGLAGQEELREIDETRDVAPDVIVQVEALVRTVRVTGWDRDQVRVQATIDPEREEFAFDGDRGTVDIEIDPRDDRRGRKGKGTRDSGPLMISVPRGASLEVDVVNGSLVVENVDGSVELESVNGNVRYAGGAERVDAETVNGRVRVEAPRARRTRAGSVNGDVVLRLGGGFVEAETVSGNLDIRADGSVESVTAEAVAGSVDFRGAPVAGASLAFETHSGDVTVRLPADVQARLDATTFSGRIESEFGGEAVSSSRWTSEQSFRHTVGDGGVRVATESFSGDVRFLRLGGDGGG